MKEDAPVKEKLKRGYLFLLLRVAAWTVGLFVLFSVIFQLWRVQGMDMYPSVRDGDLLLASRLTRGWQRGDIVIYQAEGKRRVGRIVAVEADLLGVTEEGNLMVNGAIQSEDHFYPTQMEGDEPVRVPEGTVYILGDHRSDCRDSRDFGPIEIRDLEGKVISLFRRREF